MAVTGITTGGQERLKNVKKTSPENKLFFVLVWRSTHQMICKMWQLLRTIGKPYAFSDRLASFIIFSKAEDLWAQDLQPVTSGESVKPSESQVSSLWKWTGCCPSPWLMVGPRNPGETPAPGFPAALLVVGSPHSMPFFLQWQISLLWEAFQHHLFS